MSKLEAVGSTTLADVITHPAALVVGGMALGVAGTLTTQAGLRRGVAGKKRQKAAMVSSQMQVARFVDSGADQAHKVAALRQAGIEMGLDASAIDAYIAFAIAGSDSRKEEAEATKKAAATKKAVASNEATA